MKNIHGVKSSLVLWWVVTGKSANFTHDDTFRNQFHMLVSSLQNYKESKAQWTSQIAVCNLIHNDV